MEDAFNQKIDLLLNRITTDKRWDLDNETLFVVMGMTYYGYCLGYGKLVCMQDNVTVNKAVVQRLVALGAGTKYTEGLVDAAEQSFFQQEENLYNQLVNIGHNYFMMDEWEELIDNIYDNTITLMEQK
ncbi:MAG: hypothetical protein LBI72_15005 [Flavobacteriaceae bacterium]|jgi:hypothetical protein|nr:hypothetical protein [Flavobacteriaceae bacterium]